MARLLLRHARLFLPEGSLCEPMSSLRLSQSLLAQASASTSYTPLEPAPTRAHGPSGARGHATGAAAAAEATASEATPQLLDDKPVSQKNWSWRQLRKPQNSGRKQFERMYKKSKFISLHCKTRKAGEARSFETREALQKERWKKAVELFGSRKHKGEGQEASAAI